MFRYVFFIMMMTWGLLGIAASDDVADEVLPDAQEAVETVPSPVEEEENDEPSLEEPTTPDSTSFEPGEPPVTEESLEEEDADNTDEPKSA